VSDRNKLIVLLVLIVVFVAVNLRNTIAPAATSVVSGRRPQAGAKPGSRIPDAEVVDAAIDASAPSAVAEAKRNIFQYGQLARPVAQRRTLTPEPVEVAPPRPEPPKAPVRFFGFARQSAGGARRVFLTNGEETFIAREGDVFMQRYRVARVGNDNVEIEEISGRNRWVVPLEQP